MKTTRKLLAMVLCLCMVLSCVPALQAFAVEAESNETFEIFGADAMPKDWSITSIANNTLVEIGGEYDSNYSYGIVEEADGNKAIAINKNATGYAALTSPAISMETGASYMVTYSYRTAAVGVVDGAEEANTFWGMKASVHFFEANGDELAGTHQIINSNVVGKSVSENWSTVTYEFTAVEGAAYAKVLFGLGGQKFASAQMLFDNIKVVSASSNELINGNFDQIIYKADGARTADIAGPWGWSVVPCNGTGSGDLGVTANYALQYIASTVEEAGNKVLKIEPDPSPYGYVVVQSSYVKAQPNTQYLICYDQKIENGENVAANYPARTRIYYYDSEMNLLSSYNRSAANASQDWTSKYELVTTPDNTAYITVGFFIGGTAKNYAYYYDNVSVCAIADCFNEDFEYVDSSNVPYNWGKASLDGAELTTVGGNWAGNYSIGTVDLGSGEKAISFSKNSTGYAALTSPALDVKQNVTYLLTFDYRTAAVGAKEGATSATTFFGLMTTVHFYNENGEEMADAFLKVTSAKVATEVSESWTTTIYEFTAPAGAVSAKIFFGMGGQMNATAQLLFKNVSVAGYDNTAVINGEFNTIVYEADGGRTADIAGPWGWKMISSNGGGENIVDQDSRYALQYIASTVVENDNQVLKMEPDPNPYGYAVLRSSYIDVQPLTAYALTYDRKIENGENALANYPARTLIYYYDADMNFISCYKHSATNESQDWNNVQEIFKTPADAEYIAVGFFIGGAATNYAYYYDNVKLGTPKYTVQYVADGQVVGQYTVEHGCDVPAIVPVPEKEGNIGTWDHDGLNITADTVITAVYSDLSASPLWQKTVLFSGDSICMASDRIGWAGRIGEKYTMEYVNAGVSGASVSTVRVNRMIDQIKKYSANDYDFVILHGGTNDAWSMAPVGEMTDSYALSQFNPDTFAGALEELFYYAKLYYGNAKFGYIINFRFSKDNTNGYLADMTDYVEMTKQICEKWDIPYLDMYNNEELNAALDIDSLNNFKDTVHPNSTGYDIITPYIDTWMNDVVATYEAKAIPVDNNIEKWNITLGDNIGANFYVTANDTANTSVKVTVAGNENTIALNDKNADGYYVISVDTAAAQMTDEIQVELIVNGESVKVGTYSVYEYAQYILAGEYSAETKALVKEMLNYGAAAQDYFNYNQENKIDETLIADAGINEIDGTNVADMVIDGSADGIRFYGASLVFESKVAVRFYFTVEGDINNYTFSAGKAPVEKDGMYYVEVAGINPQDYAEVITLTVNDTLTISYSPMNYIVRKGANGSDSLKVLLKAMYNYYMAAADYVK